MIGGARVRTQWGLLSVRGRRGPRTGPPGPGADRWSARPPDIRPRDPGDRPAPRARPV